LRHVFRTFFRWKAQANGQTLLRSVMSLRSSIIYKSNTFLHIVWRRSLSAFVQICFAGWRSLLKIHQRSERFCQFAERRAAREVTATHFQAWWSALVPAPSSEAQAHGSCFSQDDFDAQIQVFKSRLHLLKSALLMSIFFSE
jgi:hypothetical protein